MFNFYKHWTHGRSQGLKMSEVWGRGNSAVITLQTQLIIYTNTLDTEMFVKDVFSLEKMNTVKLYHMYCINI